MPKPTLLGRFRSVVKGLVNRGEARGARAAERELLREKMSGPAAETIPGLDTGGAKGLNLQSLVNAANVWREYYNPLHQLTLQRAVALLQAEQRGLYADLQWTYKFIEERFPTLFALIERRASAILELDYHFKTIPEEKWPAGATRELAEAQAAALRQAYERIDNLKEAIEFLALATFRGFSHLEKIYAQGGVDQNPLEGADPNALSIPGAGGEAVRGVVDGYAQPLPSQPSHGSAEPRPTTIGYGAVEAQWRRSDGEDGAEPRPTKSSTKNGHDEIVHLEPVEQWHWTRKSLYAPWLYNANAMQTNFGVEVPAARFIIREVKRPINRLALILFIKQNLGQKDWDAFVEIYGIPNCIILGPPNVPVEKESDYQEAAENVAKGASGYLPNGSDVKYPTEPRGQNPFAEYLRRLDEQLILVGTGGLLTMLTQSGSGTLAGAAHQETFELIAKAEAGRISEVFQRQLDAEILARQFPGQPRLAYFELAANEETDVAAVVEQVNKLAVAGYRVEREFLAEKTGYAFETAVAPAVVPRGESDDALPTERNG